jgi:hypothetical protein
MCHMLAGTGRVSGIAAAAAVLVFAAAPALAQTPDFERFSLSLGVFVTDRSSNVQLDGSIPGSGTARPTRSTRSSQRTSI